MIIENLIHEEFLQMTEGLDVWHGSTEKFETFDMNKVGSGDNNSLGGWGLYFSDSPEVSKRHWLPKGQLKQHEIRSGKYFDLDQNLDDSGEQIARGLERIGVDSENIDEFRNDYAENPDVSGKQAYDWLSYVLGGEKQASLFLKSLGYLGNTMTDRWERQARNYIVFDTQTIIA